MAKHQTGIRVSNSLDPDQARRFVGPDLDVIYLQTLSADGTSRHSYFILSAGSTRPNMTAKCKE